MKIKAPKTSIKTRSLAYFLILAAATIALLWILQGWFFSVQFANLSRAETIRTLERHTANYNYETDDYDALLNNLKNVASSSGMVIYCFAVRGGIVHAEEKDDQNRPLKFFYGEFEKSDVITPYSQNFFNGIEFEKSLQNNIIHLVSADTISSANTNYTVDDRSNKISYASFKTYSGGVSFYFYMEATLSKGDIESGVYRVFLMAISFIAIVLCLALSLLFSRLLSKPIDKLSLQAGLMAAGAYKTRFPKSTVKEVDKLAQSLNLVAEEFDKTEQLRRDFLANITHDFRTPLTLIRGYAELIRDYAAKEIATSEASAAIKQKQSKNAQIIIDESLRLANLVDDIQRLSKIQAGTDAVNRTVFDINEFLKSLIGQFGVVNIKYGCPIEYVFDEKIRLPVAADNEKIAIVMYNLISNAINYAAKESPKVAVRLSLVTEKKQNRINRKQTETIQTHYALVEVIDNGKGIPDDEINSVWDRYYRASQKKRNTVGTGLGLSIVKSVLTAHNADFGIKSKLEEGTTFWFKLKAEM